MLKSPDPPPAPHPPPEIPHQPPPRLLPLNHATWRPTSLSTQLQIDCIPRSKFGDSAHIESRHLPLKWKTSRPPYFFEKSKQVSHKAPVGGKVPFLLQGPHFLISLHTFAMYPFRTHRQNRLQLPPHPRLQLRPTGSSRQPVAQSGLATWQLPTNCPTCTSPLMRTRRGGGRDVAKWRCLVGCHFAWHSRNRRYVYKHPHIHTYTYTQIHTYTHTHRHTYTHIHIHTRTQTHIRTYTHTHIHRNIHTHIQFFRYASIPVPTYIVVHSRTRFSDRTGYKSVPNPAHNFRLRFVFLGFLHRI